MWATLLLIAAGLGPFAGTLALALHTAGVLGRLFAEAIENAPPGPGFALRMRGVASSRVFLYATLPLVLPQLLSYSLYRWENNIRAAAVLGAMRTVGQTKPNLNVVCVVPATENCVDGNAQKPGDIVRAYNGKTIEVHNTDAEGRLILCDALAYTVEHYAPNKIVDLATLTGGVIVALGHYAAGVMATDDGLYADIEAAAGVTGNCGLRTAE